MNHNEKTPIQNSKVLSIHKRIYSLNKEEMHLRPVTSQTIAKNSVIKKTISNSKAKLFVSNTEPYDTFDSQ